MQALCENILEALKHGPLVLASIITQSGSAPRTSGARMLIVPDGSIKGTIGGGRYEAECIKLGLELMRRDTLDDSGRMPAQAVYFPLNQTGDMDMICGGDITVLLELVTPSASNLDLFTSAADAELEAIPFVLFSELEFERENLFNPREALVDGAISRHLTRIKDTTEVSGPFPPEICDNIVQSLENDAPFITRADNGYWLFESFRPTERIHIIGAGHVSLALAGLAGFCGFSTSVLDDREEYASHSRFPGSHVECLPSLQEKDVSAYFGRAPVGGRDAVVIVTRGHAFDRDALAAALHTRAGYIGMIGSSPKRKQVYSALLEAGFTEADLGRVYSPIGLSIGAETPEEIAVSIIAQLIQWRRNKI